MDAATLVHHLIRIVSRDNRLPSSCKSQVSELRVQEPYSAYSKLCGIYKETISLLDSETPKINYVKCVGIENFWRHYLNENITNKIPVEDYQRIIENDIEPDVRLLNDLAQGLAPDQVIIPACHSWLVPESQVARLTSAEIKAHLNFSQKPPYVIMVFPVNKMRSSGMLVRVPLGIDAIPMKLTDWYPENVPNERIDMDIPLSALGKIEWRL